MGLWTTIKSWLNIGGVKVKFQDTKAMLSKSGNIIAGKVVLTSKSDKHVRKIIYKLVFKETKGQRQEKETKEFTLAQNVAPDEFDINAGESKILEFAIHYSLANTSKTWAVHWEPSASWVRLPLAKRMNTALWLSAKYRARLSARVIACRSIWSISVLRCRRTPPTHP